MVFGRRKQHMIWSSNEGKHQLYINSHTSIHLYAHDDIKVTLGYW